MNSTRRQDFGFLGLRPKPRDFRRHGSSIRRGKKEARRCKNCGLHTLAVCRRADYSLPSSLPRCIPTKVGSAAYPNDHTDDGRAPRSHTGERPKLAGYPAPTAERSCLATSVSRSRSSFAISCMSATRNFSLLKFASVSLVVPSTDKPVGPWVKRQVTFLPPDQSKLTSLRSNCDVALVTVAIGGIPDNSMRRVTRRARDIIPVMQGWSYSLTFLCRQIKRWQGRQACPPGAKNRAGRAIANPVNSRQNLDYLAIDGKEPDLAK